MTQHRRPNAIRPLEAQASFGKVAPSELTLASSIKSFNRFLDFRPPMISMPSDPPKDINEIVAGSEPFLNLTHKELTSWLAKSEHRVFSIGSSVLRPDELSAYVFFILSGTVRLIAQGVQKNTTITLAKKGVGELVGWSSLLRGEACEYVIASDTVEALALPSEQLVKLIKSNKKFFDYFSTKSDIHEAYAVALAAAEHSPIRSEGWEHELISTAERASTATVEQDIEFTPPTQGQHSARWFLSTAHVPEHLVGEEIIAGTRLPRSAGFTLPYRIIGLQYSDNIPPSEQVIPVTPTVAIETQPRKLEDLGIVEADKLDDSYHYPIVRGRGQLAEVMAVIEMASLHQGVPFRADAIQKVLEDQFRRDKGVSLELLSGLCELLGLNTELAEVNSNYISSIEPPALMLLEGIPIIFYGAKRGKAIIGHPHKGLQRLGLPLLANTFGEQVRLTLPRRNAATPLTSFGWGWFTPLLGKYKNALIMVFVASLLAQLFALAVPLLIQQIIDKVLAQGNLSSLNVLGTAMIVMALFSGILTALRTYIFVDTTDRIDLTLGSSVIDRLLSLPLSFFERRPVGELSQRLGELNTIRSFLTGTALISVLNLIFAATYLVVMLLYSPLLTAVALSTIPLYILLVFGVAPIYKRLIRNRAVAQARTQSHLIEVLSGIQTVKAQHFELTARWKWQDRYRHFVDEGFKSVALGATSREIGNFLNQLSGLLVLWVGMWLVLKGDFTLGMLIAFRIISSNVTSPLLQLSGLYQGFQTVQLAMERLSDILDQNPELNRGGGMTQISLPPIIGEVRFEDVSFRFKQKGPYQINNVSINIPAGSFVGIVGQSGSGKSTLMKLLPRLYDPEEGRIYIDNYDIAKVDLSSLRRQIGIVPQDSLLFEGSIADNIALNDPQASSESIIEAARIACAHDFIMSLGQGYATQLTERGANLSGGQRQRIAIARTILANPQLLVMDEATSALDFNTERQLCHNLQSWARDRTIFFITHRLSTVKSSDIIIVMHEGRIDEVGSHDSLIEMKGRYSALYNQQSIQS